MPEKIKLYDVATSRYELEGSEDGSTVADLLEEVGIDLSKSKAVIVYVNGEPAGLDAVVKPGDDVLMTRNICNN